MFSSNKKKPVVATVTETIIGTGTEMTFAEIKCKNSIRIDGRCTGNIFAEGDVTIDEHGYIEGDIIASNVLSAGTVKGNVTCQGDIHLAATAVLEGNIQSSAVIIDEGAVFCGNCNVFKNGQQNLLETQKQTEDGNMEENSKVKRFKYPEPDQEAK